MRRARSRFPLIVVALLACSSDDDPAAPPDPDPQPTVDEALVGTWVGPIVESSTQGSGIMTLILSSDGSMSATVTNPAFHPIPNGTWGVSEGEFTATGADTTLGVVSFTAPRSTTRLTGTWSSGANGTFDVTKQ